MIRRNRLQLAPQDVTQWENVFEAHLEPHYQRRLLALRYLWEGYRMNEVCQMVDCNVKTLRTWVDRYLNGGYDRLLEPIRRPKPQQLGTVKKRVLRHILLHKHPKDYHLEEDTWSVPVLEHLLKEKWGIELKKSRIYQVLNEIDVDLKNAA